MNTLPFTMHGPSLPLAFGMPSGQDLLILLVIVLILFGAKRLPELARGLGQSVNEFKKAKEEFDKETAKTGDSAPAAPRQESDRT
jgi:sec-independent protein translocase protein TatA